MDISKMGKGAIPNPKDLRDYRFEIVAGAIVLPEEFSVKDKISRVENQDGSLSCVAQAVSSYTEVLNTIETGEKTQLSPRDIYSLIYLPEGGSYLRDAFKRVLNGVVKEDNAPSYENGAPPSETFMRQRADITNEAIEQGQEYMAKSYTTWDNKNFNIYKQAIYQGNGCVAVLAGNGYCWQKAILTIPDICDWHHAVFLTGWKKIDGVEYIEFLNSWGLEWGDNGYGYVPKEYIEKGLVINPTTMIDLPNNYFSNQLKLISIIKNLILLYQQLIAKLKK
jgi:C1A family cysteine protease